MSRPRRATAVKAGEFITRVLSYGQVEAAVRARLRLPEGALPAGSGSSSTDAVQTPRPEWDAGIGLAGTADYLAHGWDAGNAAVAAVLDIADADTSDTGGWDLEVAGDFPCVPAFLAGDPECMFRKLDGESPRRVRLVLSNSYSCFIDASDAIEYAKACASYAAGLMAKGYDVAITTVEAINTEDGRVLICVPVKEYGQEPSASKIAFAVHPAFLRRALFAVEEMDGTLPRGARSCGYGTPCFNTVDGKAYMLAAFPGQDDERTITLPPLTDNGQSMATLLARWETDAVDSMVGREAGKFDKQAGA